MVQLRDRFEHVSLLERPVPSTLGPQRRLPAFGDEETAPKQFAGNAIWLQPNNTLQEVDLPRHGASPLPTPDLVKFDGNPVHYPVFVSNFEAHVGKKSKDPASRLPYLFQYWRGEARALIEFCAVLDPHGGYQKAREILFQNFAQPHIIARSYVNQLAKGPAVKSGDAAALVRLVHQLEECSTGLQYLNYAADLNNIDNILSAS